MRKWIVGFLVVILGCLVTWKMIVLASQQGKTAPPGKIPIAVRCTSVTVGNIEDVSEFTGTLAGKSEVLVSPKISGRLKEIFVDMGDEVKKGQLLATLDDEEAQHDVEEAKAKLVVARASLNEYKTTLSTTQREMERIQTLLERKVAAVSELESAQAEFSRTQARKEVADAVIIQQEAVLQAAQTRLTYTKINAPLRSFVGKRFVDVGVMLSTSTPIVSLADISEVKTVIGVVERDYAKIKIGLKALLSVDAYPGKTYEGQVSRIAPILDLDTRTAETEIIVSNEDLSLKPGMFTRVHIHFGVHENVVLVPNEALVKRESHQGVFTPDESKSFARFVELTPGLCDAKFTEVRGIDAHTQVIVMGQHLLNDGDNIVFSDSQSTQ